MAALLGIGAMMIYSTTVRGDGALWSTKFVKQMGFIGIGLAAAFAMSRLDYRVLIRHRRLILAITVVLLLFVFVPGVGKETKGAKRWLQRGPINFQPSELAKLALVIFLSGFLAERAERELSFKKTFLPAVGVTAMLCVLVLLEPDIGTCLILGCVATTILFVAGAKIVYLFGPVAAAAPVIGWLVSRGYAKDRITAWIDPWQDPGKTGYHIIQSLIAIGSGGITGVGLGASKQKLFYLPESDADFIFAVFAEETGLIGVTLVLALYLTFILCGIYVAKHARDDAGMLLATGLTSIVAVQAITNIAVVTKIFPTKGLVLPFMSAGGSSAVMMLVGVAILYSVSRFSTDEAPEPMVA
jgi:cell division protein FtsW